MRIENFGRICAIKYALPNVDILKDISQDIKDVLSSYVFDTTSKNPIIQYLDRRGYEGIIGIFVSNLINDSKNLMQKIDYFITESNQDNLLMILMNIKNDILQNKDQVVEAIRRSIKLNTETSRNEANRLASKFDITVTNLAKSLTRKAKIIEPYCTSEFIELAHKTISTQVESKRMPLTKMQLFIFSHSPIAEAYGLTSIDVLEKLLSKPEMREKLTTVINATHRGHNFPKDASEIMQEAKKIAEEMALTKPNQIFDPIRQVPEEQFQEALRVFKDPGEIASHIGLDAKKRLELERAEESPHIMTDEELEEAIKLRDEQHKQRQEQSKKGSFLLDQLLRMDL